MDETLAGTLKNRPFSRFWLKVLGKRDAPAVEMTKDDFVGSYLNVVRWPGQE